MSSIPDLYDCRRHGGSRLRAVLLAVVALVLAGTALANAASAATFTVQNSNDSGSGSLRKAIADADADPAADTIDFAPEVTGTIALDQEELQIKSDMKIDGPGAGVLTVSGRGHNRVFSVTGGATATIAGLRLADGWAPASGQGRDGDDALGGGIDNAGALTLTKVTVSDNLALAGNASRLGGDAYGGGIHNSGTLTLDRSTVTGNRAIAGHGVLGGNALGGGIDNSGALVVIRTTLSSNAAAGADAYGTAGIGGDAVGGGIRNSRAGTLTLTNATVSGNRAAAGRGGDGGPFVHLHGWAFGGGVYNGDSTASGPRRAVRSGRRVLRGAAAQATLTSATLTANEVTSPASAQIPPSIQVVEANFGGNGTFRSTIVSSPRGASNCGGGARTSQGFNLEDGDSCGFARSTDQDRKDPTLAPLQDNGGATRTHAIPRSSPALDQGLAGPLTEDQRGLTRPVPFPGVPNPPGGDAADVGAYELQEPTGGHAEIVGRVRPTRATAGVRTCFGFKAKRASGKRMTKVKVRFAGERERTDGRGKAVICARLKHEGRRTARFRKAGFEPDEIRVRVGPHSG